MTELLLGVDVGTTYVKAAVVTLDGVERAHGRARTPWRPVPTGAEVDAYALVEAALGAAQAALAIAPVGRVAAVGVTGMAETGVLLDRDGEPLLPAIAWHDSRGGDEADALGLALGEGFVLRTGLPPSAMCSLVKLRWLRANRAEAERAARWLNVGEWVVRSLGGDEVAELSLASRTGFLDVERGAWWDDSLAWADAPPGFLPEPAPAGTPAGAVTRRLERARGAVLTVAGHDHLCAAAGAAATRLDDVLDSCGTAEGFVRALAELPPAEDVARSVAGGVTVGRHVLPERFALLGGFDARGAPEAVEQCGRRVLDAIESVAGETGRLVVTGGRARDERVRELKRAALGPFEVPRVEEAGARGAALAGGCAAGLYPSLLEVPAPCEEVPA